MDCGFVKKENKIPKRRKRKVGYDKFFAAGSGGSGAGALVATANRNCDFFQNCLQGVVGARRYQLYDPTLQIPGFTASYGAPRNLFGFWFTHEGKKKESVGVVLENKRLYIYDELNGTPALKLMATNVDFRRAVRVFDNVGDEKVLLCYNGKIYLYNALTGLKTVFLEESVTDACFFNERLFLANGQALKFSAALDYENFKDSIDDGGVINLVSERGNIVGLKTVGEKMYIFLESGVMTLTSFGAARDFVVEDLLYKGGPIVPDSICVCGEKIAFLAEDGIFVFDGRRFEEYGRGLPISCLPQSDYCRSAYGFGRYFLTFDDKDLTKRTVFVDLEDKKNFGEMYPLNGADNYNGKVICGWNQYFACLDQQGALPNGEKYTFEIANTDFNIVGEKFLQAIELVGKGECFVTARGRNGEKTVAYELDGKQKKCFNLKGDTFSLLIELKKGCVISGLVANVEQVGERG